MSVCAFLRSPASARRPRLLRGASFLEAFPASECAVLKALLDRHVVKPGALFKDTPAFLPTSPASATAGAPPLA
jgi:hypothetical protein